MRFTLASSDDDFQALTIFHDGNLLSVTSDSPNFDEILRRVLADDVSAIDLISPAEAVAKKLEDRELTGRVRLVSGRVLFDGEEVNNAITEQIIRFIEADADFLPLVKFLERLSKNPNDHSREQLYRWLNTHSFTITPDGYIVGYKGVSTKSDGTYWSINSGTSVVDGVSVTGVIPNQPGSYVEMPWHKVTHDPSISCAQGLHVGTWDYARSFSRGAVLEIHVDPADVVSIPTDSGDAKMRVAAYKVISAIEQAYSSPVVYPAPADFDDDDVCDICDEDDCDGYCDDYVDLHADCEQCNGSSGYDDDDDDDIEIVVEPELAHDFSGGPCLACQQQNRQSA